MNTVEPKVNHYFTGSVDVVEVVGEVTILQIDILRSKLTDAARTADKLVIDLRESPYIDSAALEAIIYAYSKQTNRGKSIAILVKSGSQPDDVLHVVQVHTLMTVTSDPAAAGLEV